MRIWTQNLLAVLPVFIALALALGIVFYLLERHDLIQGARDQAAGQAVTIAEFDAQLRATGAYSPAAGVPPAGLLKPLATIVRYGPASQIVELGPQGRAVQWAYPASAQAAVTSDLAGTPGLSKLLRKTGFYVAGPIPSARGPVIRAYARTTLAQPGVAPIIGLEVGTSNIQAELRAAQLLVVKIVGGVLGLGIAVVLLTSVLITREVRTLSETAGRIAGGALDVQARPSPIQEVADLGNTFNTMGAVLRDVLSKTRRSLIEGEQFRTDTELADTYATLFRPPLDVTTGGIRFFGGAVGDRGIGAIWLVADPGDGPCAVIGHVAEIETIEASVAASSAIRFLQDLLPAHGIERSLGEAAALFTFSDLLCLQVRRGRGGVEAVETCRCSSTDPDPARQTHASVLPHAIHTLGSEVDPIVDRYLELFGALPVDELWRDLVAALPPDATGVLVIAGVDANG
jgi:hypothetical protein